MINKKIILASGSPRRHAYLQDAGIEFEIQIPNVDESSLPGETPEQLVKRLSTLKAHSIAQLNPQRIVLAADTVVALSNKILGKPNDREDAFLMLKSLNGKTHEVHTAVSILSNKPPIALYEKTKVTFRKVSDPILRDYVASGESDDKSGSYAVQGLASAFIAKVEGSVSSVVGLPIAQVLDALETFAIYPKFGR